MAPVPLKLQTVDECRSRMRTGDVLLTRGQGFVSWCIRALTGYDATHASQLDTSVGYRSPADPMPVKVHEVRELVGAQCVDIADVVADNPGRVDWYRLDPHNRWPEINRHRIHRTASAWTKAKMPYGYLTVFLAFLLHCPIIRWFTRRPTSDHKRWAIFPDCSAFVSGCLQSGGVDLFPGMSHRTVEPGHFSFNPMLAYEATLIP